MKEYTVEVNGVEHTFQLSDEDAERLGAKDASKSASNKSRSASNKGA